MWLYSDARLRFFSPSNLGNHLADHHQTLPRVRWWRILQFSRCCIFVTFRNKAGIIVHYDNTPFWISADTNKDDLEWPGVPNSTLKCDFRAARLTYTYVVAFGADYVTGCTLVLTVSDKNVTTGHISIRGLHKFFVGVHCIGADEPEWSL